MNTVGDEPANLRDFSWGAFGFSGIWGLCNGIYWPILANIALVALMLLVPSTAMMILANVIWLIINLYLGFTGRLDAWAFKKWKSPKQFISVQRAWNIAGIIYIVSLVVIIPILAL